MLNDVPQKYIVYSEGRDSLNFQPVYPFKGCLGAQLQRRDLVVQFNSQFMTAKVSDTYMVVEETEDGKISNTLRKIEPLKPLKAPLPQTTDPGASMGDIRAALVARALEEGIISGPLAERMARTFVVEYLYPLHHEKLHELGF